MTYAALIVAAISLVLAYLAWQRSSLLSRQLASTREDIAHAREEVGETRRQLEAGLRDLRMMLRKQSGDLKFLPSMTIAEAMDLHPRAREVLESYQLGSCSNCAISDVDTLEGACRSYGIDLPGLMAALSALLEPGAGGPPLVAAVRRASTAPQRETA